MTNKMLCHITDYDYLYQNDNEPEVEQELKSIGELTLYEVGAEDLQVSIKQTKLGHYRISIEDEDGVLVTKETINSAVLDSMAQFCRQFLSACARAE